MKKVQFILFAIILMAIAGKASLTPVEKINYAVLSIDAKLQDVESFFKYKVNNMQMEKTYLHKGRMQRSTVCCNA